jgi:hypothetical protein
MRWTKSPISTVWCMCVRKSVCPQIAALIFDRVFKNVSATSKYLLVLSEYMASKHISSIEPNLFHYKTGHIFSVL